MKKKWATFIKWQKTHKTAFAVLMTIIFALVQLPVLFAHTPGLDEASIWARASGQATTTTYAYNYDHAEPQTFLWSCLLTPFARLGFPVVTMNILSFIIVVAAVYLLFRYVRAPGFLKLCLAFSAAMFYYNPIIARSYSLLPLALILVVLAFKKRAEHPFRYGLSLFLLSQVHYIMWGAVGVLAIEEIYRILKTRKDPEMPKWRLPSFLLPVGALIAMGILGVVKSLELTFANGFEYNVAATISDFFDKFNAALFGVSFPVIILVLLPVIVYLFMRHTHELFGLACSLLVAFVLMYVVYNGDSYLGQKAGAILGIVMLWVLIAFADSDDEDSAPKLKKSKKSKEEKPKFWLAEAIAVPAIVSLPFAASIPRTIVSAIEDLNGEFSYSGRFSDFLDTIYEGKNVATVVVMQEARNLVIPEIARGKYDFYDVTIMHNDDTKIFALHESYESQPVDPETVFKSDVATARELIEELKEKYTEVYLVSTSSVYFDNAGKTCGSKTEDDSGLQYDDSITADMVPYITYSPYSKNDYKDGNINFEFYRIK